MPTCSSVFDALIMWSHGVHAVTAVHDDNLNELVAASVKHGITKVTICFPRTDEGQNRTDQLKERLSDAKTEVFRVLLPSGMDIHEVVKADERLAAGLDGFDVEDTLRARVQAGALDHTSVEASSVHGDDDPMLVNEGYRDAAPEALVSALS